MNVYEAAVERIKYIFSEFDNIYVSFSGGKDSGVLLNIVIDIAREINRKFTVLYIDLEGMYKETIWFIQRMLNNNKDIINIEWVCLPLTTTNAVSMYEPYWVTWQPDKKDKWIREIPDSAINIENNKYSFYNLGMSFEEFVLKYAKNQSIEHGKTACLLGIRTQESLNRWRAVNRSDITRYKDRTYSVLVIDKTYNFYPLYDWKVEDIWTYNSKFNKDYNKIYDCFNSS